MSLCLTTLNTWCYIFQVSIRAHVCMCTVLVSITKFCILFTGKGEYLASPEVLGPWVHDLTIACNDADGYNDVHKLKFTLQPQPKPRKSVTMATELLSGIHLLFPMVY